ncbi:hypothetical protein [Peptostreptococcus faecalis]|uniref:hypothetical protein n=1 Tax=Peptostreptococcus faecalis TaxID=2045015 RepID=UPI000C7A1B2F|nr:hypothetical protein [Peptostreptococcus faecalis]
MNTVREEENIDPVNKGSHKYKILDFTTLDKIMYFDEIDDVSAKTGSIDSMNEIKELYIHAFNKRVNAGQTCEEWISTSSLWSVYMMGYIEGKREERKKRKGRE